MQALKKGHSGVAVIDIKKKVGVAGQYTKYAPDTPGLATIIAIARAAGCELRYYYQDVKTIAGETIPIKIVVTEIPPGHVQPFHTHETVHEVSFVNEGVIAEIESEVLSEQDIDALKAHATEFSAGEMVVEEPGKRHTIANFTDEYAKFTTTQSARLPHGAFAADWKG